MKDSLSWRPTPTALLARLVEAPDLVQRVRALPPQGFSALVRQIGVEDAGEIVAIPMPVVIGQAFQSIAPTNESPLQKVAVHVSSQ